jgi:uncharacterized damage-inducible protein DinB
VGLLAGKTPAAFHIPLLPVDFGRYLPSEHKPMKDLTSILTGLKLTYPILDQLTTEIPLARHKIRRIPGKWSIHEQACHLADVQPMLLERMQRFATESPYLIQPYLPGDTVSDAHLMHMDLAAALEQFRTVREAQLAFIEAIPTDSAYWHKTATHPQYSLYTPLILLRHTLMHDHFHMYRMEELWLTEEGYL